jgi:hypothetical protein
MPKLLYFFSIAFLANMLWTTGYGFGVALSTNNPSGLQGEPVGFIPSGVIGFDTDDYSTASVIFDQDTGNLNAFHILNGNFLFSTTNGFNFNGMTFADGEIVEFNPTANTANSYINFEDILDSTVDIDVDAFSVLSDGRFVFSTLNANSIVADPNNSSARLPFTESDLVAYHPVTGVAEILFNSDLITGGDRFNNTSAVRVMDNGSIALSVATGGVPDIFLGGATFQRNDVVLFDPSTGTAEVIVEGSDVFSGPPNPNVDAFDLLAVPESNGLFPLLGAICVVVTLTRRRHRNSPKKDNRLESESAKGNGTFRSSLK